MLHNKWSIPLSFSYCWGSCSKIQGPRWGGSGVEGASAAASRRRLYWSALDLHVWLLSASSCGSGAHSLLDLSSHGHEGLLHIGGVLSASFQERNAKGISKFLEINQGVLSVRTAEKWTIANLMYTQALLQNLVSCLYMQKAVLSTTTKTIKKGMKKKVALATNQIKMKY